MAEPVLFNQLGSSGERSKPVVGLDGSDQGSITNQAAKFGNGARYNNSAGDTLHGLVNQYIPIVNNGFSISQYWRPDNPANHTGVANVFNFFLNFGSNVDATERIFNFFYRIGDAFTNRFELIFYNIATGSGPFGLVVFFFEQPVLNFNWNSGDDVFIGVMVDPINGLVKMQIKETLFSPSLLSLGTFPPGTLLANKPTSRIRINANGSGGASEGVYDNIALYNEVKPNFETIENPRADMADTFLIIT